MLSVTVHNSGKAVILRCVGRIVRGQEARILCAALGCRKQEVILDLSRVHAIDAAGIGALVSLQAAGLYLRLKDPSPRVREILSVTKLDSVMEIGYSPLSGDMTTGTEILTSSQSI